MPVVGYSRQDDAAPILHGDKKSPIMINSDHCHISGNKTHIIDMSKDEDKEEYNQVHKRMHVYATS